MVSCSASPKQQLPGMDFFIFFPVQSDAKTSLSLLPPLQGETATLSRQLALEFECKLCERSRILVLVLPWKVRRKEKGAGCSLGRVQFLQRNEESSHRVSWKPGRTRSETETETRGQRQVMVSLNQRRKLLTLNKRLFTLIAFQKRLCLYTRGRCWQKADSAVSALKPAAFLPSSPVWWKKKFRPDSVPTSNFTLGLTQQSSVRSSNPSVHATCSQSCSRGHWQTRHVAEPNHPLQNATIWLAGEKWMETFTQYLHSALLWQTDLVYLKFLKRLRGFIHCWEPETWRG